MRKFRLILIFACLLAVLSVCAFAFECDDMGHELDADGYCIYCGEYFGSGDDNPDIPDDPDNPPDDPFDIWDCSVNGHQFHEGSCEYCGEPDPYWEWDCSSQGHLDDGDGYCFICGEPISNSGDEPGSGDGPEIVSPPSPSGFSLSDLRDSFISIFTSAISWVSTVSTTVLTYPLLLLGVILGFIGIGVGLFKRLLNV